MKARWSGRQLLALLLLGGVAACDAPEPLPDDGGGGTPPTPITVVSTAPVADEDLAPYGLPVSATFDQSIKGSTATTTSFTVLAQPGGEDVPRKVTLSGGTTVVASASLLPGATYRATISQTLASNSGGVLDNPYSWTFSTRPIVPFVLDTGRVGYFGRLSLAKDSLGGLHAVYADSVTGNLYYSECSGTCAAAANWSIPLSLDPLGNVGSSSAIAADATNRIHIVYRDDRQQVLRYATCASACSNLANFSFATVDNSSIGVGIAPSLYVTPAGVVHTAYYDYINAYMRYSICLAACGLDASWVNGTADPGGSAAFVGESSSIAVDGATRHIVYQDSAGNSLKYATCTTTCVGAGDWTTAQISLADGGKNPSLVLGPNKELEVTYYASTTGNMKFAFCASACITIANWTTIDLTTTGIVGQVSSLTVDALGRAQATFVDNGLLRLRYATCSSVCSTASRWRYSTIQESSKSIRSPALIPGGAGGVQMLYLTSDAQAVRFAQ